MLTIARTDGTRTRENTLALARYYIDYAAATETPGLWYGTSAVEALGLQVGEPGDPDVFLRLVEGITPDGRRVNDPPAVPFFDLTLSLPKSLSILAYCHPDPAVGQAVRDVLETSTQRFTEWLQDELAQSRRGHQGRDGVVDAKVVGLGFRHATNRNDQPHAHVHLLMANVCQGADGRWRTLDSSAMFGSRQAGAVVKAASQVHDAIVRDLCRERGIVLEWSQADDAGLREVKGMDRATIEEFSRDLGIPDGESFAARQVAAYRTRSKKSELLPDDLTAGWLEKLAARRWTPARLAKLTSGRQRRWTPPHAGKILAGLTEQRTTFSRVELMGALALAAPAGAPAGKMQEWADTVLASQQVVPVVVPPPRTEGVAHDPTPARWSTPEAIATERGMIDLAMTSRRRGGADLAGAGLEAAIAAAGLDPEQADAVRWAAAAGLVRVIEAEAGTGKTHSMRALVDAANQAGVPVIGLAISGQAVVELVEGSGVEAHTIAAWSHPGGEWAGTFQPGQMVIVDEASMVGTSHLSQIVRAAHQAGGRVVLVGDREQLGSVDAGGGFATLADKLGSARLTTNRRMADDRSVQLAAAIRSGRAAEAVGHLTRLGRIVVADDPEAATAALLADWWDAREAGHQTAILAYHRADVARLNAAARQLMADAGKLSGNPIRVPSTTKGKGLADREFRVGDDVVCLRKQVTTAGKVVNGTRGKVVKIDRRGVVIVDKRGNIHRLTNGYVTDFLDLGYATTDHKSQGSTVGKAAAGRVGAGIDAEDRGEVFVYGGESMSRQAAYVAMTRGTDRTRIYSASSMLTDDEWHDTDRDPVEGMTRSWAKSEAQDLGITEADRARQVVMMAAGRPREDMEQDYDALASIARHGRTDPVDVLADAAHEVEALRVEGVEPDELKRAEARLVRVEAFVASWGGDPPNLVQVRGEVDLLADALATQRRAAILEAVANPPGWMVDVLGPVPTDPARTYLWAEGAGCLIDGEHWVTQARLASGSKTIREDLSNPDVVRADLTRAATSTDLRQLDEIVDDEQADAAVSALIAPASPSLQDDLEAAPVVRRIAMAQVAAGIELDDKDVRDAVEGTSTVGLAAHRLREALAEELPAGAPAAAQLALLPGVTFPATRAVIEAGRLRRELAGEDSHPAPGGEIARDVTPPRRTPARVQTGPQFMPQQAPQVVPDGPTLSL